MTLKAASETIAVAEIGGTSVKIGFADHGVPLEVTRTFSTSHLRRGAPATQLAGLLQCASVDAGLTIERVVATVPGFIGRDCDTIIHAANIPELNGIRLASELASTLSVPVQLERDVVLQLLGKAPPAQLPTNARCWLSTSAPVSVQLTWARTAFFAAAGGRLKSATCRCSSRVTARNPPSGSRRTPLVRLWWTSHLHMASP